MFSADILNAHLMLLKETDMEVLNAVVTDAEEILKLQKTVYISEVKLHDDYSIPPVTQTLSEIKREFHTHTFLKVVREDKIIAAVKACEGNGTCYIGRLIVDKAFQNQGIGTMLLKKVEEGFDHLKRYVLYTDKKNERSIRFYNKLGYEIFREQILNPKTTLVYLEKKV